MTPLALLALTALTGQDPAQDDFDLRAYVEECTSRIVWIQREITTKVLTPSSDAQRARRQFLKSRDTGMARLTRRSDDGKGPFSSILFPGGGAYYSFDARSHGYSLHTDIYLASDDRLRSGTFVGDAGLVIPLGPRSKKGALDGLEYTSDVPEGLPEAWHASWRIAWAPVAEAGGEALIQEAKARRATAPSARAGESYLVRARMPGNHDVLVAMAVDEVDVYGVTIAWRLLERFPMLQSERRVPAPLHASVPDAPSAFAEELERLSIESLGQRLLDEREEAKAELLTVPNKLRSEFQRALGPRSSFVEKSGFVRLMRRDDESVILTDEDGACYYGFAAARYGWGDEVQIALDGSGQLHGGYEEQWLLDLGGLDHDQLKGALAGRCPVDDKTCADAWALMRAARPVRVKDGTPSVAPEDMKLVSKLGITSAPVPASQGHGYLLRTLLSSTHDQLIFFLVLEDDGLGLSIAWKILESYPMGPTPRDDGK